MTIPREVGQLALDNLESLVAYIQGGEPDLVMQVPAIEALRAALAAKEPKETAYEIGQRFYRTGFGISDIWGAVSHDSQMDDAFRGYADAQMEKRGFGQEQAKEPEPVAWILKTQIQTGEIGEILSWSQSGEGLCERLFGEENETPLYTSVMKCNKKTDECICNELEATKKRLDSCDKLLQEEWQARQALLREHPLQDIRCECCGYMTYEREHLGCIRSAYRTQTEQEPFCYHDGRNIVEKEFADHSDVFPLYTTPQPAVPERKPWVGLTQEDMYEIGEFKNTHGYVPTGFKRLAAAIEAKLKEKNDS